jgi:Succinylglutamate desuccinylase / Aspartoacylase family
VNQQFYPIGIPGQPWGEHEIALWRQRVIALLRSGQVRKRSYADDVLSALEALPDRFGVESYGEVTCGQERFPLMAVRNWQGRPGLPAVPGLPVMPSLPVMPGMPLVLITGGVHGYETSGVQGALRFLQQHASGYAGKVNLLVVPCVSPWAYERMQRWNFDAVDPNRSFKAASSVQEAALLMQLIHPLRGKFAAHIDLHETTDSDESEFRPALAARDGKAFEPGHIPDGFYLVDDAANPQSAFQAAIIEAVSRVTHIAPADEKGEIIGSKVLAAGVIEYNMSALGLCAGISGARYTTTTEVYPDSPRTTPEQCIAAQVAALCSGLDYLIENGR